MEFIDTHCHIHDADYPLAVADADVEQRAREVGVSTLVCVGTDLETSRQAVAFVRHRPQAWASVGVHPHEATDWSGVEGLQEFFEPTPRATRRSQASRVSPLQPSQLTDTLPSSEAGLHSAYVRLSPTGLELPGLPVNKEPLDSEAPSGAVGGDTVRPLSLDKDVREVALSDEARGVAMSGPRDDSDPGANLNKIIAIGECGLDYFYGNSTKADQQKALRFQIELALEHDLPLIFHVRDAFADFWPIFDRYQGLRGVIHSFTDTQANLDELLARGLYVGVNGITTFTKNAWQLEVAKNMPLQKILLETDAPYLTPHPYRGTVNEPARVMQVAEFLATLRGESLEEIAASTTHNARHLFSI